MRIFLILASILTTFTFSLAQRVEVNPNVKWKYVRSQKLELQNESVYQYEFPAETGHDYVFSMFFEKSQIVAYIKGVDLQGKPIASKEEDVDPTTVKLDFSVPNTATYMVLVGYRSKFPRQNLKKDIELTLIKRPFVE